MSADASARWILFEKEAVNELNEQAAAAIAMPSTRAYRAAESSRTRGPAGAFLSSQTRLCERKSHPLQRQIVMLDQPLLHRTFGRNR